MRSYLRDLEASSSPPGFDPVAMRGSYFLETCPKCGGRKWKADQEGVLRCTRRRFKKDQKLSRKLSRRRRRSEPCMTARPSRSAAVLKGHVQGNAPHRSGNSRTERVADLGLLFKVLSEEHFRAFSAYVAKGTYAAALEHGHAQWPWLGWTDSKLRRLVKEARQEIEGSFRWARLMEQQERAA